LLTHERNTVLLADVSHIRCFRQIRRFIGRVVAAKLVSAFVISRLDYGNAGLAGLQECATAPLQRVLNAADVRLVLGLRPRDPVTAALIDLHVHWLYLSQQELNKNSAHCVPVGHCKLRADMHQSHAAASFRPRSADSTTVSLQRRFHRSTHKTQLRRTSLPSRRSTLWNELSSDVKKASTLTKSENILKTFLFREHYGIVLEQWA